MSIFQFLLTPALTTLVLGVVLWTVLRLCIPGEEKTITGVFRRRRA